METAVGVVDVKSSPVYFYVQRRSTYLRTGSTIPFEIVRLNVGGGMNINSGIFTAPKSGIYLFSFTALKDRPANTLRVDLYHNLNVITRAEGTGVKGLFTATVSSTLSLKFGDRISLQLVSGRFLNGGYADFNGILLQEELLS